MGRFYFIPRIGWYRLPTWAVSDMGLNLNYHWDSFCILWLNYVIGFKIRKAGKAYGGDTRGQGKSKD